MRLLINLIPIKSGGGQQVASNFISQLLKREDVIPFFVVTQDTFIAKKLKDLNAYHLCEIKNSLFSRIQFQQIQLKKLVAQNRIDLIYTMFGPGLYVKGVPSVTGCAYSNIFFPEVDFWQDKTFLEKLKHRIIDKYRLFTTLRSNAIIFENKAMQERATSLYHFPKEKTKLILPSISVYKKSNKNRAITIWPQLNNNELKVLMLSGWHPNKNLEIIPYVLEELKKAGCYNISFVISISEDHPSSKLMLETAKKLGVRNNLYLIGSVPPNEVSILMNQVNALGLFSLLESFSNNIIEAWYFKKPLIIANEEWARAICKNAAIYVERNSAKDISEKIITALEEKTSLQLQKNADFLMKAYPNPQEKVELQISFLKDILNERSV